MFSVRSEGRHQCIGRGRQGMRGPGRLCVQLRMAYAWALARGYDAIVAVDGNGKDVLEAVTAVC